ncbi:MAG: hypothetical protein WBE58_04940 [Verrucomicrobiales bacterium]
MSSRSKTGCTGCGVLLGLFLILVGGIFGGVLWLIQPTLLDYELTMKEGAPVPGKITAVEPKRNLTINGRHPDEVFFTYGEDPEKTGQMLIALGTKPQKGSEITVRVRQDQAYPEGIEPLRIPKWLWALPVGIAAFGVLSLLWGILKILLKLFFVIRSH